VDDPGGMGADGAEAVRRAPAQLAARATVRRMYVETVVQVNDHDTYQASVRLRSGVVANRPPVDAYVRFAPAGWLTMRPLAGGRISVVSAAEVFDVTNLERVQAGDPE
jgi:hypothetical protein